MRRQSVSSITLRGAIVVVCTVLPALLSVALAPDAWAGACNITPRVVQPYRSDVGLVDRPVAGPGDVVTLYADLGCVPTRLGFSAVPAENRVFLDFEPPTGVDTTLELDASTLDPALCGVPGVVEPSSCDALRFTVPDTTADEGLQLTGPVRVRVERTVDLGGGPTVVPVVDVSALNQPTSSCTDRVPDTIFGRLTIVPRPNVVPVPDAGGAAQLPEVVGAITGGGDLVVPWSYENALLAEPGEPVATLIEFQSLANGCIPGDSALNAFSHFGAPIPPIQRKLDAITILVTADVLRSIARIAAVDPATDLPVFPCFPGTPSQIDPVDLIEDDRGPVRIPFLTTIQVKTASPLLALRSTAETVAIASDEVIVGELNQDGDVVPTDLIAGATNVDTNNTTDTNMALVEVTASPERPSLVAAERYIAFPQSEARDGFLDRNGDGDTMDGISRVFDTRTGLGLTPAQWVSADPRPVVGSEVHAFTASTLLFRTFEADEGPRTNRRMSQVQATGAEGDGDSEEPSVDATGSSVAFASSAANLVPGATVLARSIYVTDAATGAVRLASESAPDVGANADSARPALTGDGSAVAFESVATDIVTPLEPERVELGTAEATGGALTFAFDEELGVLSGPIVFGGGLAGANPGTFYAQLTGAGVNGTTGTWTGTVEGTGVEIQISGTYLICPGGPPAEVCPPIPPSPDPLGPGSALTLMGSITSIDPPLAPGQTNPAATFEITLVSVTGPPGSIVASADAVLVFEAFLGLGQRQIYLRELGAGGITRVASISGDADLADGNAFEPAVSHDGRHVAFAADAANLVPGDTNGVRDVFVHDRDPDGDGVFDEPGQIATVRVSVASDGSQATGPSGEPAISADGRFVVFASDAIDLVDGDGNGAGDVFLHDRDVDGDGVFDEPGQVATIRASVRSARGVLVEALGDSSQPDVSDDGRFVVFTADAAAVALLPEGEDTNAASDVLMVDRSDGSIRRVSADSGGVEADGPSGDPSLSGDGRYVVFRSTATNLVPDDASGFEDVFRFDRHTGAVERVSTGSELDAASGPGAVSGDGLSAAFVTAATNYGEPDSGAHLDVVLRGPDPSLVVDLNLDGDGRDAVLQSMRLDTGALQPGARTAAALVVASGDLALVFTPEADEGGTNLNAAALTRLPTPARNDVDADDVVAQLYDAAADARTNLGVAATSGGLSASHVCLAVSEAGEAGTDLNADGDAGDRVLVWGELAALAGGGDLQRIPVAVEEVAVAGSRCVFTAVEADQGVAVPGCAPVAGGCDFNGDGDAADRVLGVYDAAASLFTNVGQAAEDFLIGPEAARVALRTCESDQGGTILNGDDDTAECVVQLYEFEVPAGEPLGDAVAVGPGRLLNTERCGVACSFPGCPRSALTLDEANGAAQGVLGALGPGGLLSFVGTEECQGGTELHGTACLDTVRDPLCDLDNDGDGDGRVVHLLKIFEGSITSAAALPVSDVSDPAVDPLGAVTLDTFNIGQVLTECEAAALACVETRGREPVGGVLDVLTPCEALYDVHPNPPDGQLDCGTGLFWFAGETLDGDFVIDPFDNAPSQPNPGQEDEDGDGLWDELDGEEPSDAGSCDLNDDGFVTQTDVNLVIEALGQPALAGDRRDRDGNGVINVRDSRLCVDECSFEECSEPVVEGAVGCGLLGIEALLPLGVLLRRRRSRIRT